MPSPFEGLPCSGSCLQEPAPGLSSRLHFMPDGRNVNFDVGTYTMRSLIQSTLNTGSAGRFSGHGGSSDCLGDPSDCQEESFDCLGDHPDRQGAPSDCQEGSLHSQKQSSDCRRRSGPTVNGWIEHIHRCASTGAHRRGRTRWILSARRCSIPLLSSRRHGCTPRLQRARSRGRRGPGAPPPRMPTVKRNSVPRRKGRT